MKDINTILFDLDGTLLTMDAEEFTNAYFYEAGKYFSDEIEPKELIKNIWVATKTMVMNTEIRTNEEVFWESFHSISGDASKKIEEKFEKFYEIKFPIIEKVTRRDNNMIKAVHKLKENGYTVVVATNPMFPRKAIHDRIKWAGFNVNDFEYVTSFEDNHYCKPQIKYYEEILANIGKEPKECLMVGNDVKEDIIAGKIGIKTWLMTNCIIESNENDLKADYSGSSEEFFEFIKDLSLTKK